MISRRLLFPVIALAIAGALLLWERRAASVPPGDGERVGRASMDGGRAGDVARRPYDERSVPAALDSEFPLAAELNAPDSTILRDLEVLSEIFVAWRTNFPRQGNPVGLNSEITAALSGDNPLGLVLVPRSHRAINREGELCDRWGTPFRFHQISADHMEIRSAGPDRRFGTADDVEWLSGAAVEGLNENG